VDGPVSRAYLFLLRQKLAAVLVLSVLMLTTCLGGTSSLAQGHQLTIEEKLREIRARYAGIKRELSTYRMIERELTDFSTEGGTLKAYVDRDRIKSLVAVLYGETGRSYEEYYYDDAGELFFVFQQENRYDKPFGRVVRRREERLYFDRGHLIRWLRGANQPVSPNRPEYREREKSVLDVSRRLVEAARSADEASAQAFPPDRSLVAEPLHAIVGQIKQQTSVPIFLPSALPSTLQQQRLYVSGAGVTDGYQMTLTSRPDCGANSCFVGSFEAHRGGEMAQAHAPADAPRDHEKSILLVNGIEAYYKPLTCGGSCSPPIVEWVSDGVLYHIQFDVQWRTRLAANEVERLMVAMANSAIKAGAR
jgi:hypothetical protein